MSHPVEPTTTTTQQRKGRGLAITALVVAIVSLLLCWIPIVNNVVFFLGIIGLALAIPAYLRARKGKAGGSGMAVAAIVVSALSLVGVLATQALYVSVLNDVEEAVADAADGEVAKSESDKEAETEAKPLAVGQSAKIGEYEVTVKKVDLDATKQVMKANQFNEKPKGQYVLTTLGVTYVGDEEGDPWIDLTAKLSGSDARNYGESTCQAVVPQPAMDVPTLSNGGKATYNVCFDVPAEAVKDAKVYVEASMSFDDTRQYWSTK